jgi:hypothetical protein
MPQNKTGVCGFKDATKYQFGNESFPVLFDDGLVRVYKNPTNEIFVEDKETGATMRINRYPYGKKGLQFITAELVEPIQVNNTIGWRIGPR